jgi:hypothetical protein
MFIITKETPKKVVERGRGPIFRVRYMVYVRFAVFEVTEQKGGVPSLPNPCIQQQTMVFLILPKITMSLNLDNNKRSSLLPEFVCLIV